MKIFDKSLYRMGLRQCAIISTIFTVIMMVWAVFYPISCISQVTRSRDFYGYYTISSFMFNPLFIFAFCAYMPFLLLSMFSFLNHRNGSDFFHSIPHRRETLFFSYLCAALTCVIASLLLCSLTTLTIGFWGADYIHFDISSILIYLLSTVSAVLLVAGAVMIAMSLTGTLFTNIVTALLIIFLPRLLIIIFNKLVLQSLIITTQSPLSLFGTSSTNAVFAILGVFANTFLYSSAFSLSLSSVLYTTVLGLIYIVFAALLFRSRKSEVAGNAALNNRIQAAIRISLSLLICSIAFSTIVNYNEENFLTIVLIYSLALIVYFTFELLTRKKLRALKQALPGLFVLLLLNLVFIGGTKLVIANQLKINWQPDEIESIQYNIKHTQYQQYTYEDFVLSQQIITDPDLLAIVSEDLAENQAILRDEKDGADQLYTRANTGFQLPFIIKMKNGRTIERDVFLQRSDYELYESTLIASSFYQSMDLSPPEDPNMVDIYFPDGQTLSGDQIETLYETFCQEYKQLDPPYTPSVSSPFFMYRYSPVTATAIANLMIEYHRDGQAYYSTYEITEAYPKTYALIQEIYLANKQDVQQAFLDTIYHEGRISLEESAIQYINISFWNAAYNAAYDTNLFYDAQTFSQEDTDRLNTILSALAGDLSQSDSILTDLSQPYCTIYFEMDSLTANFSFHITDLSDLMNLINSL